jgi:hypothetical protein
MRRETSKMNCFPEAVTAPRKVMTENRRRKPGIDAAEHDKQIWRKNVSQSG